ncbi:MAG: 6-bladed beta-propeller [Planctomycetota bacterium]|nr:6-bladed beta-propeller [Planctomycetota bacterium]
MGDSDFFKYAVGLMTALVIGLTLFLGSNDPETRTALPNLPVRPPAVLPTKEDVKLPPRYKAIGEDAESESTPSKADTESPETVTESKRWSFDKTRQSSLLKLEDSKAGYLSWFGGSGKKPGQFAYPRAMVIAPNDRLYVVDKSGRIQRYNKDGRLEIVIRTPKIDKGKPTGLGIDKNNRVLVADTHYARVLIYSPDLELVQQFGQSGPEPGNFLFVTDVCQAQDGRHFVTDYGDTVARVQIFDAQGRFLKAFGTFGSRPGEFQRPMALCIDEKNSELLVADAVNHRIQIFDLEGRFKRALGSLGEDLGQLKYPYDVTQDRRGRLWIAEFGNHRLQVLDRLSGKSEGSVGSPGRRLGEVAYPWGVCLTETGRFFFLDSGNDRVYMGSVTSVLNKGQEP